MPIYSPHLENQRWMRVSEKFSYKEQERENCEHCRATGHKINPHNVKGLSEGKRVIKRRVKKAISIDQRKPSVSSDELGMDLSAISNPIV